MEAPESREDVVTTFATSDGDQVVLKLRDVRPGQLARQNREQRQAVMQQLATVTGNAELMAVQKYLSNQADIEMGKSD